MILKKIFIITTVLLLASLVFFGIYMAAFKDSGVNVDTQEDYDVSDDSVDIAEIVDAKITNVTSDSIVAATIGPDGDTIRYYDALSGDIWTMTLRGTNKKILTKNQETRVPKKVAWSSDGNAAILTYENGDVFVQNNSTGGFNKLRDGMDAVEWAGVGGKILYKYFDESSKERSLNISNSDGTNWKKIAILPFRYTKFVQIPSSILAAFWPEADVNISTELLTTSIISDSENQEVFSGKSGADFSFSPDGDNILMSYSVDGGVKTTLATMKSDGSDYADLQIPTLISKAVWSNDSKTVYYAQPSKVPEGTVWPNDYTQKKFTTQDTFYKVDTKTGKKDRIIKLEEISEQVDAINLFLSPSEDMLFFTNRVNGLLYRINL